MRYASAPVSTHRLQLEPDFTLDDAVAQVDHLATLGITHLYLSPVLQATVGSKHGYDVTDHTTVAEGLGGDAAFARLVEAAHAAGLGVVVDVVPNHMTTPTPLSLNRPLWSVLREGRQSAYATWFDVDWDAQDGRILMPVLGAPLDEVLAAGEISVGEHEGEPVVRYYDHVFPLAAGHRPAECRWVTSSTPSTTASRPGRSPTTSSTTGASSTSPRSSRCASRSPRSSTRRTQLLVDGIRSGAIDGLRIDHPDGLADPEGYLERLAEATGDAWVVVEKILEGDEQLPHGLAHGRHDRLRRAAARRRALRRPRRRRAARRPLGRAPRRAAGPRGDRHRVEAVGRAGHARHRGEPADAARRAGAARPRRRRGRAQVHRGDARRHGPLPRLPAAGHAPRGARRRRAPVGRVARRGERSAVRWTATAVDVVVDLALGQASPVDQAAQPTSSSSGSSRRAVPPWPRRSRTRRTTATCGSSGSTRSAATPPGWACRPRTSTGSRRTCSGEWPQSMTTLSTHDTKRAEDVRARLFVLAERPDAWATWVRTARELAAPVRAEELDVLTEYFLWQTLVGAWPISEERLQAYALKAIRESKLYTRWTEPDEAYESAVERFVSGVVTTPEIVAHVESWVEATRLEARANVLGQKLVQLTMPGVPDVYQGTDLVDLSLVDPDNRRAVDYAERRDRLARLDGGARPGRPARREAARDECRPAHAPRAAGLLHGRGRDVPPAWRRRPSMPWRSVAARARPSRSSRS